MRISDWSSDVCSSDLDRGPERDQQPLVLVPVVDRGVEHRAERGVDLDAVVEAVDEGRDLFVGGLRGHADEMRARRQFTSIARKGPSRSEEHTSELQSLMRISYAVFCLKKKKKNTHK